jgi:predicted transcriptional regulator
MGKTEIQVGRDLRSALAEVATVWKAAAEGTPPDPSRKLYFADWSALCSVLTPKRSEWIRHLRHNPAPGVRALARALGREVKRVHEDVVALAELGLISRDAATGALSTALDEISSTIRFAAQSDKCSRRAIMAACPEQFGHDDFQGRIRDVITVIC